MRGGKRKGKPTPHSSWLPADTGKRFLRRGKINEKRGTKKTEKNPTNHHLIKSSAWPQKLQKLLNNKGVKFKVLVLAAGTTKRQGLSRKGEEENGGRDQKMNEKASVS